MTRKGNATQKQSIIQPPEPVLLPLRLRWWGEITVRTIFEFTVVYTREPICDYFIRPLASENQG